MLESVFGESGAVVAEFFIILVLVLIVMGLAYWLYRQYAGPALGGAGKGRGPRLAVVDTLSIDHRHRLVLVRRDNVEHLLLVGKTADLVVEPSIVRAPQTAGRPRPGQTPRPQAQKKPTAPNPQRTSTAQQPTGQEPTAQKPAGQDRNQPPAPMPAANSETGISEPIPFPQGRRPQPRAVPQDGQPQPAQAAVAAPAPQTRAAAREMTAPAVAAGVATAASASAHFEETTRPTRVDSAFSLADALDEIADEPVAGREVAQPAPAPAPQPVTADVQPVDTTVADRPQPTDTEEAATDEPAPAAPQDAPEGETTGEDSATKVSNLEQEMARLLGEITAKRDA